MRRSTREGCGAGGWNRLVTGIRPRVGRLLRDLPRCHDTRTGELWSDLLTGVMTPGYGSLMTNTETQTAIDILSAAGFIPADDLDLPGMAGRTVLYYGDKGWDA